MTEQQLEKDFDLNEVADALGMSPRWVRDRCKEGAEHNRYGQKIRFTAAQVQSLREAHKKNPTPVSITTGRGRKAKSA